MRARSPSPTFKPSSSTALPETSTRGRSGLAWLKERDYKVCTLAGPRLPYLLPCTSGCGRQGLSGVLAHFFRAALIVWKGQPNLRGRPVTKPLFRLSAAETRIALAPLATRDRIRSSSSGVHRRERDIFAKSVTRIEANGL